MTKQKEYSVSVSIKELNIISEKIMIKFGDWSSCKYNFILFKFKFVFPNNYWIKRIKVKRKVYNWFPLVFFLFFLPLIRMGFWDWNICLLYCCCFKFSTSKLPLQFYENNIYLNFLKIATKMGTHIMHCLFYTYYYASSSIHFLQYYSYFWKYKEKLI